MKDFFKEIFAYHHHYNRQLIEQITGSRPLLNEDTYQLLCHVLNAHQVWNSRILKTAPFKVWQNHEPEALQKINQDNFDATLQVLDGLDLEDTIHYVNTRGDVFDNTIRDVLFHVSNHTTYHRGQLASRVKAAGIAPLVTDYIFYKREAH